VDFASEALVLLPATGNPTTEVGLDIGPLRSGKLACTLWSRRLGQVNLPSVDYLCFALAVDKAAVGQLEVSWNGEVANTLLINKQ
jgi:hypothetical protein